MQMGAVQVMHERILLIPTVKKTWKLTPWIMRAMRGGPTVRPCFQDCHGIGGSHLPKKCKACIQINGIIEI